MATRRWLGTAVKVKDVWTITVANTWAGADTATVTINGKDLTVTVGSLVTAAQVATSIKQAWEGEAFTDATASCVPSGGGVTIPEHSEYTATVSGAVVTLTADAGGIPHTISATESTAGDGTATAANTIAATGPYHFTNADNWSGGSVPVAGDDVVFDAGSTDCRFGLAALTGETLASVTVDSRYTGRIGNSRLQTNAVGSYAEYRGEYLAAGITSLAIGRGSGLGSPLVKIDGEAVQSTVVVESTGTSGERGAAAVRWKGTHAANAVNVLSGTVDIAPEAGETATVATLRIGSDGAGGPTVRCGAGTSLTTAMLYSGEMETRAGLATLNQYGGESRLNAGNVTTLDLEGGTCRYLGTGTITTISEVAPGATLDFSRDPRGRTVTNAVPVYRGATILDPAKTVAWSGGIVPTGCGLEDVTLRLGHDRTVTVA